MRASSSRSHTDTAEVIHEVSQLIASEIKDHTQLTRRLAKLCKQITRASSVEVGFLEEGCLHLAHTQQAHSRLPLDESSLQGHVALSRTTSVVNNPGTSMSYAKFPIKLKAYSAYTGEQMDALSIAVIPLLVSPR